MEILLDNWNRFPGETYGKDDLERWSARRNSWDKRDISGEIFRLNFILRSNFHY